ncbi:MAG: hypothetical protein IKY98_03830 [Alphaproteobacteria bacterium]|nr:hypothetical protein [Alphaproteobacteria bacterium]
MEQTTTEKVISISEYAQVRGCSVAAVYKRLDGTLKPFVKVINNKKYLTSDVLELEGIQPVETGLKPGLKGFNPGLKAQEHPGNQEADAREQTPPAPAVGVLEALEALERQLAEKDRQISRLQEEAAEMRQAAAAKDKFIQEQASRLALLLEQSQELQRNNQILLGIAQGGKPGTPAQEEVKEHPDSFQEKETEGQEERKQSERTDNYQEEEKDIKKPGLLLRIWRAINEK